MADYSSFTSMGQNREQDFQKLAKTIGTSIQKISQNGRARFKYNSKNLLLKQ